MKRLIIATRNRGKIKEFESMLAGLDINVASMVDAGIDVEIDETGSTFEENALIKASSIMRVTGEPSIADDSGLEVDSLNGAPGIYSARYSGEGAADSDNNAKLLAMLKDVPDDKRTGRFVCAIALVLPNGVEYTVRGECEGKIGHEARGTNGFGYDPLFYIPEYGMTMAELEPEIKNNISHRAKALKLISSKLKEVLR